MGYSVIFQHVYYIRVIVICIALNTYPFVVSGTFRIPSTSYYKIYTYCILVVSQF
jgi:hypothetical protein